jgi:hypothetical protein
MNTPDLEWSLNTNISFGCMCLLLNAACPWGYMSVHISIMYLFCGISTAFVPNVDHTNIFCSFIFLLNNLLYFKEWFKVFFLKCDLKTTYHSIVIIAVTMSICGLVNTSKMLQIVVGTNSLRPWKCNSYVFNFYSNIMINFVLIKDSS